MTCQQGPGEGDRRRQGTAEGLRPAHLPAGVPDPGERVCLTRLLGLSREPRAARIPEQRWPVFANHGSVISSSAISVPRSPPAARGWGLETARSSHCPWTAQLSCVRGATPRPQRGFSSTSLVDTQLSSSTLHAAGFRSWRSKPGSPVTLTTVPKCGRPSASGSFVSAPTLLAGSTREKSHFPQGRF